MSFGDLYVIASIVTLTTSQLAPSFLQVFLKIPLLLSLSPVTLSLISAPHLTVHIPFHCLIVPLSTYYYNSPYLLHIYLLHFLPPLVERKFQEGRDLYRCLVRSFICWV